MSETVSPDFLASQTLASMPTPTITPNAGANGVSNAPRTPPNAPATPPSHDSLGRPFDPIKFHKRTDTLGRWVNRRSGGGAFKSETPPNGVSNASATPPIPEVGPGETPPNAHQTPPDQNAPPHNITPARAAAEGVVVSIYTLGSLIIDGEEWMPQADEHEPLVAAWEHMFKVTGVKEPPAWMVPAIATGVFLSKRFTKPKTRSFIEKVKAWAHGKILERRGRQQSAQLIQRTETTKPENP